MASSICDVCGFNRGIRVITTHVDRIGSPRPTIHLHLCGDHFDRVYNMITEIQKGNPEAVAALTL